MHLSNSWRRGVVGACAAALVLPLALTAGSASAATSSISATVGGPALQAPLPSPVGASIDRIVPGDKPGVLSMFVNSAAMGGKVQVDLLVPPGWRENPGVSYPEMYLLEGLRGPLHSTEWVDVGKANEFFANKNVLVAIPVAAGGTFSQDWNVNDPGILKVNDNLTGPNINWKTFLTQELPAIMGSSRIGGNGSRGVAGLSQGGFSAFNLAATVPGMYKAAGSFSGFPDSQAPGIPQFLQYVLGNIGATNPDDLWGTPDQPRWTQENPAANVGNLKNTSLYMSAGTGLNGPYDAPLGFLGLSSNYVGAVLEVVSNYSSQSFGQKAAVGGVKVTTDLTNPGVHAWPYWQFRLQDAWPQIANSIGATDATCTVKGAIADLVRNTPNQLGACVTNEEPLAGHSGMLVQKFANGHVYFTFASSGVAQSAYFVQGVIDARYQAAGGPSSPTLGLPLSNELPLTARGGGAFSVFQGGKIYWSFPTGPQIVKGAIFTSWGTQGYENGRLGYPTSEEVGVPGGVRQNFQGGYIVYTFVGDRSVITYT